MLSEIEGEPEIGPLQRFDRLQGLVVTYSRATRDVAIVTERLPVPQLLEELPSQISPESLHRADIEKDS